MDRIDNLLEQEEPLELLTDGGRYTDTYYAWYDHETKTLLYHTEVNNEFSNPFFNDEESAKHYLEQLADNGDKSDYEKLSLRKFKAKKIGEAVEVLTDQAGLNEFAPDGGLPDTAYLWYDPLSDSHINGLFQEQREAIRFIADYTPSYKLDDIEHLELYEVELEKLGNTRTFIK